MKEHPILFSAPMVRALLAGHKTQTRRAVKPQPAEGDSPRWTYVVSSTDKTLEDKHQCSVIDPDGRSYTDRGRETVVFSGRCPYGQPGDRLWVRENGWQRPERTPKMMREGADTWEPYYYDADGCSEQDRADFKRQEFKRRPSIHMPRWASRITLEIVSVHVERLQDISEDDAKAEGIHKARKPLDYLWNADYPESGNGCTGGPVEAYRSLWESINGVGSWAANPWVWVVEFRRIKP